MTKSHQFLKGNLLKPVHPAEGNEEEHCGNHKSQKPGNLEREKSKKLRKLTLNKEL